MGTVDTASTPASTCRLLAFDTATESCNLALITPSRTLILDSPGGAQASTHLLPDIRSMLAQAGCALGELDAIAFGCGPGAFTGLRTACSVAQGLAFGADKPVIPVDSLMLVAESVRPLMDSIGATTVWVTQDARMDEIYAAAYGWQGDARGRWQTLVAPALYTLDRLQACWATARASEFADAVLAGSAVRVLGDRLPAHGMRIIAESDAGSRAAALARLAVMLWHDGVGLDAAQALPLYLRDKVALTTAERDTVRAAKVAA